MSSLDLKIKSILSDLKVNHNAVSLKSEFETEGATYDETKYLADLAQSVGLDLNIKIGGCAAVNDIRIAKEFSAKTIVAPMIESGYAVEKFVESVKCVYENYKLPNLFINIETITGVNNINKIINSINFEEITGVVFGRSDMAKSLGQDCSYVDSQELLEISKNLSENIYKLGKIFIIGGGISPKSYDFLNSIKVSNFETRKIIFDKNELGKGSVLGILKALEFEILWYKSKQELFGNTNNSDSSRLKILQERYDSYNALNL